MGWFSIFFGKLKKWYDEIPIYEKPQKKKTFPSHNYTLDEIVANSPFRKDNMNLHYEDEQRIRFNRGVWWELREKEINESNYTGTFRSREDDDIIYNTSLNRCTCPDYKKRYKPCKHMYFLARKFGVMNNDCL